MIILSEEESKFFWVEGLYEDLEVGKNLFFLSRDVFVNINSSRFIIINMYIFIYI